MLAGALLLLLNALGEAIAQDDWPGWLGLAGNATGYVLLITGFVLRMRDYYRRAERRKQDRS